MSGATAGNRIVFVGDGTDGHRLYVGPADGSQVKPITSQRQTIPELETSI